MEDKAQKGKWRLNALDIVIIVIAIALAAAVLLLNSRRSGGGGFISSGTQETVLYTIILDDMTGESANLIREGDALVDKVEKRAIGTIEAVIVVPYRASQRDGNTGDFKMREVPGRQSAVITVRADATVTGSQISVGGFMVRAGIEVSVTGPMYAGHGYIVNIDRDGDFGA